MDIIKELATVLGGMTIAVGALAWLAKSLITHFLSKDIDKFKAELSAKSTLEIEKLRAELGKQAIEHEIKYRRVDEKVAEHLAEVYRRLFRLYESVESYVRILEWSSGPSKEDKCKIVSDTNKEFWDYLLLNRIYLPPRLYKRIREVADKLGSIANDFTHGHRDEINRTRISDEDYWSKAFNDVKNEATPLFSVIVYSMQKILGVEDFDVEDSYNL